MLSYVVLCCCYCCLLSCCYGGDIMGWLWLLVMDTDRVWVVIVCLCFYRVVLCFVFSVLCLSGVFSVYGGLMLLLLLVELLLLLW